ncbi:dicarboxylate/amino acid:cation symporter [Lysobacter capsici]|jgi:aerobic C4-dicarboxylate transport protein|uniref:dicarboxylate/amino acid:cation symporter n=1 Tax=Lysobacter capsici TaxID=435897 RepID=UPI0006279189|nr:dicarboxylate/amino acid:cation symporter [Lysobacter capsici]ATE72982.1 dicarboxylate/amino acid:cation symporter [Lysobacter capsici]UOF13616.1 dicarboxylate/amino acid:cation symporter [Lysobacter capsici]
MKKSGSRFYLWVLGAIVLGGVFGHYFPDIAVKLKPLGDGFISLIKMLIAPIIFLTVVLGIAGVSDVKKVGRVGVKAIVYFEVVSTIALVIGLVVVNTLKPGAGFNVDPATLDASAVEKYAAAAKDQSTVDFILHIIPKTFTDAFTGNGDLLQVLLMAVLFGFALLHMGKSGEKVMDLLEAVSKVFFGMMSMIMKLAPIGAGAAMAFTIGKYGVDSLGPLAKLMGSFYLTCALFILIVLGSIAHFTGFSILRFIRYIRDELLLVLGTSSSESALVPLMRKLERLGCSKSVVGLVVPSGYSFNLDGTNIYLTMATIFVAQALGVDLTLTQELTLLMVAMLTSKGASGVTGAGFITLAATLTVVPSVPVAGLALILGIDRFMSEARALTNFIGNGVATIVVARWENELDRDKLNHELANPPSATDLDDDLPSDHHAPLADKAA